MHVGNKSRKDRPILLGWNDRSALDERSQLELAACRLIPVAVDGALKELHGVVGLPQLPVGRADLGAHAADAGVALEGVGPTLRLVVHHLQHVAAAALRRCQLLPGEATARVLGRGAFLRRPAPNWVFRYLQIQSILKHFHEYIHIDAFHESCSILCRSRERER